MFAILFISPLIRRSASFLVMFAMLNATAATITWTNLAGGNWSTAVNWSPNQVPTSSDDVLITTPGTYTVYCNAFNPSGVYNTNAASLKLGAGGGAAGVQTFVVTNFSAAPFLVHAQLMVTNGGVMQVTNSGLFATPLLVAKGAVLNARTATLSSVTLINGGVLSTTNGAIAAITMTGFGVPAMVVTNGGVLNASGGTLGSVTVANGGTCLANAVIVQTPVSGQPFAVTPGGLFNITNGLGLYAPLTNAGTINLGGFGINAELFSGLVNLGSGTINLQGNCTISDQGQGYCQFINQGIITASGGTNIVSCQSFDNTLGKLTNSSGLLALGTFQTNLAGNYFAAGGATIQFNAVNDGKNFVTPGAPFVLAGTGNYQFVSGDLRLTNIAYPNLDLIANTLVLGPAFQGGAITNLALHGMFLSNSLPVTGTLAATNSTVLGDFNIAGGGVFNENAVITGGNITVANNGVINASGGRISSATSGGWTVSHGGVVNLYGTIAIWSALTNSGTVNVSNAAVGLFSNPLGGIVNRAGGGINFLGGGSSIYFNYGPEYFINQGSVSQNTPGVTNSITVLGFDTSQGTVTNLAGTLLLGDFQTSLAGTFFAAAAATNQLIGGTAAAPVSPGSPLVLGGAGQYQFLSDFANVGTHGFLYLTANAPTNLTLRSGILELSPSFQGGAITNLTLSGIALTNQLGTTLPITGRLTMLNSGGFLSNPGGQPIPSGLYGNYTVAAGGILTVSNSLLRGTVAINNGGLMNMQGATALRQLTVANGGLISVTGAGGIINAGSLLSILTGGTINIAGSGISLGGPLNNSGTINITNIALPVHSGFSIVNDGGVIFGLGGITNQASGVINLLSDNTFLQGSTGGQEYIVNQGQIIKTAGTNSVLLSVPTLVNSGAITVESGFIDMPPFAMQPSGSLNVWMNNATNYGRFVITTTGTQHLAGAFGAVLNNGYVPTNGTTFSVVAYAAATGSFNSLNLPSGVSWQSSYGTTNFSLVAGAALPGFATYTVVGTNFIFSGTGGTAGSNYVVLASTNLAQPLSGWTALITNKFDGNGQLRFTNPVTRAKPRQYFIFRTP